MNQCHTQHGGGHTHAHHTHVPRSTSKRLAFALLCTVAVMVAEAVGAWVSGSLALLSDAGHMLTDAGALALALTASAISARRADDRRTYGFRRAEVLGALTNVVALILLAFWIGWEGLERLRSPAGAIDLRVMAGIGFVGLVANILIFSMLAGGHDVNSRSALAHVASDAASSVAVMIAAGVIAIFPSAIWIDSALSLLLSALILVGAVRLLREVTHILMEAVPSHIDVQAVDRTLRAQQGVFDVHDLHVWTIAGGLDALSAHLRVGEADVARSDSILGEVKRALRDRFGIRHTTLQIETDLYDHSADDHVH